MKGLELCKNYYLEYGLPMLQREFSEFFDRLAVGLVGHGSECFGFDDEISSDHDFQAGFNIWITEDDDNLFGFKLFRAYSKLPKEYNGIKVENTSFGGADTKGVKKIKDFYSFYLPNGEIPKTNIEWLNIPDFYLAEATNGQVFMDKFGEFTKIRQAILNDRPEDVRLKKLGSAVFYMAQSGQYNYERCLKHGEKTASAIALTDFVKNTAKAVFLLNKKYAPYYKWTFRAMNGLDKLGNLSLDLEKLLEDPYNKRKNLIIIEEIATKVAEEIRTQGLSSRKESYLEGYSYCINNNIKDGNLRNMPVML